MFFALNKDTNERLDIEDALENKADYVCPVCKQDVIIRRGKVKLSHFAHKAKCTETFTKDMTEWHKSWQDIFPKENQEIVVECDITLREFIQATSRFGFRFGISSNEDYDLEKRDPDTIIHIKHRADVLINNYVIEFQHSPISFEEFRERNWFYTHCGYKVIWVFDMQDKNIEFSSRSSTQNCYNYIRPASTFLGYNTSNTNVKLYFQLADPITIDPDYEFEKDATIELVNGLRSDFKYFYTALDADLTPLDLREKAGNNLL